MTAITRFHAAVDGFRGVLGAGLVAAAGAGIAAITLRTSRPRNHATAGTRYRRPSTGADRTVKSPVVTA